MATSTSTKLVKRTFMLDTVQQTATVTTDTKGHLLIIDIAGIECFNRWGHQVAWPDKLQHLHGAAHESMLMRVLKDVVEDKRINAPGLVWRYLEGLYGARWLYEAASMAA